MVKEFEYKCSNPNPEKRHTIKLVFNMSEKDIADFFEIPPVLSCKICDYRSELFLEGNKIRAVPWYGANSYRYMRGYPSFP